MSLRAIPNLKRLRERRGLTQEELAILSGVPRRSIARYEAHPETRVRRNAREKLARTLKAKVVDLEVPGA
jgi:transcriptional regulator with XRE-family HTH domain